MKESDWHTDTHSVNFRKQASSAFVAFQASLRCRTPISSALQDSIDVCIHLSCLSTRLYHVPSQCLHYCTTPRSGDMARNR